ncbi:MAG TPA: hypothetical protein VKL99_17445 [Candidatus Angelobacter sp.]|nr:hypothetical protein [Candidatus Angelobacter sp.]
MEDFTDQITRLSQELRAFQVQLQWKSSQCSSPDDQDRVMDSLLNAGLGQDLKRTVDLLSQFLWCYIEAAAAGGNAQVDYAQQSSRLGQITGILRLLHHSSCPLKDSLAFVEHAAMTVTRHVDVDNLQERLSLEKSA